MNREDFLRYVNLVNFSISEFENASYSCLVNEVENGALPLFLKIGWGDEEDIEILVKEVLNGAIIACTGFWGEGDDGKFEVNPDYLLFSLDAILSVECTY